MEKFKKIRGCERHTQFFSQLNVRRTIKILEPPTNIFLWLMSSVPTDEKYKTYPWKSHSVAMLYSSGQSGLDRFLQCESVRCVSNRQRTPGYCTRRQKLSIQTQVSFLLTLPLQGDWYTCFTAVTVMSDTAALVTAKGTLIHCGSPEARR